MNERQLKSLEGLVSELQYDKNKLKMQRISTDWVIRRLEKILDK